MCNNVVVKDTKAAQVSDTVEFRHHHITQPSLMSDNRVLPGIQNLRGALENSPTVAFDAQLTEIMDLQEVLERWSGEKDVSRVQQLSNIVITTLNASICLGITLSAPVFRHI